MTQLVQPIGEMVLKFNLVSNVKLGHLGLEMTQLVQHAISRSNGLEMSQFGIQCKIRSSWS